MSAMNLAHHLEPIAGAASDATRGLSVVEVATISAAVSLKRLADALETMARNDTARTCFTGDGSPNTAQLNVGANCDVRTTA